MKTEAIRKKFERFWISTPMAVTSDLALMPKSESGLDVIYLDEEVNSTWIGYQQAVKDMEEKNDNQMRCLPADIDLLILAAEALIRKGDSRRIYHLKSVVEKVRPQYDELLRGDHDQ